jgi:hypothetical protein
MEVESWRHRDWHFDFNRHGSGGFWNSSSCPGGSHWQARAYGRMLKCMHYIELFDLI